VALARVTGLRKYMLETSVPTEAQAAAGAGTDTSKNAAQPPLRVSSVIPMLAASAQVGSIEKGGVISGDTYTWSPYVLRVSATSLGCNFL